MPSVTSPATILLRVYGAAIFLSAALLFAVAALQFQAGLAGGVFDLAAGFGARAKGATGHACLLALRPAGL